MFKEVRTRFAPSPSGFLHLGGARTALFNYLFARHFNGKFILRIEDTDRKRHQEEIIKTLIKDLQWLGLKIDETIGTINKYAPYQQSKRLHLYQKYAHLLLVKKKAYRCFCTKEILDKERKRQIKIGIKAPQYNRKCFLLKEEEITQKIKKAIPFCLRFNVQTKNDDVIFNDLTYKKNVTKRKNIEDFIIFKSDQYPTYNFAVVIDDHLMEISHIIRGSDHLTNTSKQILLYDAFAWEIPTFAHLSLIQFKKGKKMSKRFQEPSQNLWYFQNKGYNSHTLFNYLSFLGWTPDKFQEIIDKKTLIARFDAKKLNKSQSIFNLSKVKWINRVYLKKIETEKYFEEVYPYCEKLILENKLNKSQWQKMALMFKHEINCYDDLKTLWEKYFLKTLSFNLSTIDAIKDKQKMLEIFKKELNEITWNEATILQIILNLLKTFKLSKRNIMMTIYGATIGLLEGPKIEKLLFLIGKEKVIKNIKKTLIWINTKQN